MVCSETWACMHARFGDIDAAEVRFREAAEMAAQHNNTAAMVSFPGQLSLVSNVFS
jgi:hypothetical protein